MANENFKEEWDKFAEGVRLTDQEMLGIYRQSVQALKYLRDRRSIFELAFLKANQDHSALRGYLINRGLGRHMEDL